MSRVSCNYSLIRSNQHINVKNQCDILCKGEVTKIPASYVALEKTLKLRKIKDRRRRG